MRHPRMCWTMLDVSWLEMCELDRIPKRDFRTRRHDMKSYCAACHVVLSTLALITIAIGYCAGQTTPVVTSVQLPTYHVFGTTTTVVVPDRGSAYLGGVNRSLRGQNRFGAPLPVWGNRGFGQASSAAGISARATLIDHDKLDRALLAAAARSRGAQFDVLGRPVGQASRKLPATLGNRTARTLGQGSTAQTHQLPGAARRGAAAETRRAATYMRRGRQAEADGQPHVAKVFYQRASRHGDATLKQRAESRLAHLEKAATADKKRGRSSFSKKRAASPF